MKIIVAAQVLANVSYDTPLHKYLKNINKILPNNDCIGL